MTPIALVLNLLLGALLVAALALGFRLDRRLRTLRDSQQGFIKAVAELDRAAARTQEGLNQWRDAADEARELLHDRIEKAKAQTAKLEALLNRPLPEIAPSTSTSTGASRIAELSKRFERSRDPLPRDLPQREPEVRDAEARAEMFAAMLAQAQGDRPRPQRSDTRPLRAYDDDLFDAAPPARGRS